MAYIEVEVDVAEILSEASTRELKEELAYRGRGLNGPLTEPPCHIISDIKRAFEAKNPHEFYYLIRKVEMLLDVVDG